MAKEKQQRAKKSEEYSPVSSMLAYLHNTVNSLNQSKIFAGVMIIILNIASRFVNIKLSKSMESYLKYTFSKQLLIFAIAWMGTRDIYIALIVTLLFTLFMDCLFNEDSSMCILPENFTSYYCDLSKTKEEEENGKLSAKNQEISEQQIKEAKEILEKAQRQKSEGASTSLF